MATYTKINTFKKSHYINRLLLKRIHLLRFSFALNTGLRFWNVRQDDSRLRRNRHVLALYLDPAIITHNKLKKKKLSRINLLHFNVGYVVIVADKLHGNLLLDRSLRFQGEIYFDSFVCRIYCHDIARITRSYPVIFNEIITKSTTKTMMKALRMYM